MKTNNPSAPPQHYWNPYVAGIVLGLVLLATFIITGHGLGASGAFTTMIASSLHTASPSHTMVSKFYSEYIGDGSQSPFADWYVVEVAGMFLGGFISAKLAGRIKRSVEKGNRISSSGRFAYALAGGALVGIGSKLARGCTSGQGLTGGALLNVGSWIFLIAVFVGAYSVACFVRRQWT